MAKSIRSKHRRRMRSVKREKFAKKELEKLQATVMRDIVNNPDSEMADIVTVKTTEELKTQNAATSTTTTSEEAVMELDSKSGSFDKKKKMNEHGQYPVWMNQRAVRKQQVKNKKAKIRKGKKNNKKSS